MQQKIWVYKSSFLDRTEVENFAKKYGISLVMAVVLFNRGIDTEEKLKSYLKKSLDSIYNPMLLPDMEEACQRVKKAILNNEKITIYGDYDADGVTSTSVLYTFLKKAGANVCYYIPDRFKEGYGLNIMAVNKISKGGTKLLITVDCGITSCGEVQLAKAQGMDVIITDHHTPQEKIPETLVINPKRADSCYPFPDLAGVGVAFKLILGLGMVMGMKSTEIFEEYVELVAIGTIADVVPLKEENRIIVDRGLKALSKTENFGINSLLEIAGVKKEGLNTTSVAFGLSPRINASGRMESAKYSVDLFLEEDSGEAYKKALELDLQNRKRQETEKKILEEALKKIDADVNFSQKRVIVLSGEGWHHGVIGIVASRLTEKFYKPCIMISEENGIGKGSSRSIPGFNIFDALSHCSDLLTKFGGHSQAAGLSLSMADFEAFSEKINKYAKEKLSDEDMIKKISIDCRIKPQDVSIEYARVLEKLEPYGEGNETPVFAICGISAAIVARIGADGKHLRLRVTDGKKYINCVGFGMGDYADYIQEGDFLDIAFSMDINNFGGTENVQLILKDIKKS